MLLPNKGTYNKMFGTTVIRDLLMSSECAKTAGWHSKCAHSFEYVYSWEHEAEWHLVLSLSSQCAFTEGCPDLMTLVIMLYQAQF